MKPKDWKVNGVNPLYLMINKVFRFVREKNDVEYLSIDKGNKKLEDSILSIWNQEFSGIKYHIKKISHKCKELPECKEFPECEEFSECKINFDSDFDKIKFVSNDLLPLEKLIYFPTLTVVIRCAIKQGDNFILKFI